MGSAPLPALGGDRTGVLAVVALRADLHGLLHLGRKAGHANKELQFTWMTKMKREETDRVCPQPNPFCLSTFDLNSSRNTGSAAAWAMWKGQQSDVRHVPTGCSTSARWRCILFHYSLHTPAAPGFLHLSGGYRFFFFFFFPAFSCSSNMVYSQLISFSKTLWG